MISIIDSSSMETMNWPLQALLFVLTTFVIDMQMYAACTLLVAVSLIAS